MSILNERLEEVETVVSGQDIAISLEYDIHDSETLKNVVVQTKFFGTFGQPLFACLSKSSGRGALELSRGTRLLCRVPRLPLQPGVYSFTIWCTVGDNLEDFVADAGKLAVAEGDYFGTGKLPPREIGDFIVAQLDSASSGDLPSDPKGESGWHTSTRIDAGHVSCANVNVGHSEMIIFVPHCFAMWPVYNGVAVHLHPGLETMLVIAAAHRSAAARKYVHIDHTKGWTEKALTQ